MVTLVTVITGVIVFLFIGIMIGRWTPPDESEIADRNESIFWWRPENWKEGQVFYQWGYAHTYGTERLGPRLFTTLGNAMEVVTRKVLWPMGSQDWNDLAVIWKVKYQNGQLVPIERVGGSFRGRCLDAAQVEKMADNVKVGSKVTTVSVREACLAHGYDVGE